MIMIFCFFGHGLIIKSRIESLSESFLTKIAYVQICQIFLNFHSEKFDEDHIV